jgi:hypothetical protein
MPIDLFVQGVAIIGGILIGLMGISLLVFYVTRPIGEHNEQQ